ncbi:SMI1/KNR4 family protein [Capnocytophaga stomatis]|uniref:SMI1/KNR4 family protein n=1 Tax=Capnocytophaga stomatis TaxID=1848904 RepID=UPI001AD0D770|nr:SMI1/KNR4 family protein [Capnocytophaga stomatis]GIM48568.1 hypothetical protein CAPN003_00200 [Capnocytophaga stomatis]
MLEILTEIKKIYQLPESEYAGFSEDELLLAEKRLNVTFPKAFREYYLQMGRTESINQSHNYLFSPEKIDFDGDFLCFYEENQGVAYWGIHKNDLHLDNPPVWGNYGSEIQPNWVLQTEKTSDFWLYMAIYNGVLGGLTYNANALGSIFSEESYLSPEVVTYVRENFKKIEEISFVEQEIFQNHSAVISISFKVEDNRQEQATALFLGSSNQEEFDDLLDTLEDLGLQWSYISYEDDDNWEDEE